VQLQSGVTVGQDDVRMHGNDGRERAGSVYDGVEFYYSKALAGTNW